LLTLAKGIGGMDAVSLGQADDFVFTQLATAEVGPDGGRWPGLTMEDAESALAHEKGPRRLLDLLLRTGPYGDGFGRKPDGLTLRKLEEHLHGVDLGPLKPRIAAVLRTPDGNIDLAPQRIIDDLPRLAREMSVDARPLSLIGRRHLRSNNSWMHNVHALVKGKPRCTLLVSGVDAAHASLKSGDRARLSSASGSVVAVVEVTDEMMPGVVSLPHGWGHDESGVLLSVARRDPGVNVNVVSDEHAVDAVSGNAAFNGLPVTLERCDPI
jgi:anaerobic selenocysteine-containing dehydrogenase